MSVILHFGVNDIAYTYIREAVSKKTGKPLKNGRKIRQATTTGDVAERLEEKYGVMEHFCDDNQDFINQELSNSLEDALESVLTGAPVSLDPYGPALSAIQDRFKNYIMTRALDNREEGVPTLASLKGVNHRLLHPYSKNNPKPRPSFRDTGNYESNFRVWVENQ